MILFNFTVLKLSVLSYPTIFNSWVENEKRKLKLWFGDSRQEFCDRIQPTIQDFGSSRCVSVHKTVFPLTRVELCTQRALNKNNDKNQPIAAHRSELKDRFHIIFSVLQSTRFLGGKVSRIACKLLCSLV